MRRKEVHIMLIGALVSYIITKLFMHETSFEKEMNELIKEEKEVLKSQSYEQYFGRA